MKYCNHCGKQVADSAKFCPACGQKIDAAPVANTAEAKTPVQPTSHSTPVAPKAAPQINIPNFAANAGGASGDKELFISIGASLVTMLFPWVKYNLLLTKISASPLSAIIKTFTVKNWLNGSTYSLILLTAIFGGGVLLLDVMFLAIANSSKRKDFNEVQIRAFKNLAAGGGGILAAGAVMTMIIGSAMSSRTYGLAGSTMWPVLSIVAGVVQIVMAIRWKAEK